MSENLNSYDDDRYNQGSMALSSAVTELWEAGADEGDIRSLFDDALLENTSEGLPWVTRSKKKKAL